MILRPREKQKKQKYFFRIFLEKIKKGEKKKKERGREGV